MLYQSALFIFSCALVLLSTIDITAAYAPDWYATDTAPASEPTFGIKTRRRINNCDQDWMKDIESQAWSDAYEIAKIAYQWKKQKRDETLEEGVTPEGESKRNWQDAMDYYMGNDSVKDDATSDKIENALKNEKQAHEGNYFFPEPVIDIYCGSHPSGRGCKEVDDPNNPGQKTTAFAHSWIDRGNFWNTYNVVLCPRFFVEKDSLWGIKKFMDIGQSDPKNATVYKYAWGFTIYHELMHLDPVIADRVVYDVVYYPCRVAQLAQFNGCSGKLDWEGWNQKKKGPPNSMNNADSWAMYASAAYWQNLNKLDEPGKPPDCDVLGRDSVPGAFLESTHDPPGDMPAILANAQTPPEAKPEQIPADPKPVPSLPFDTANTPEGLAVPYKDAINFFNNRGRALYSPPDAQLVPPGATS